MLFNFAISSEKPKRLLTKAEIMDKKRKLKEKFNAEYDGKDGETGGTYYDELKQDATKQAEVSIRCVLMSESNYTV